MSAVFSHGRLRLYLLRLLAEGPKHGYEVIRVLEERFLGLYVPSAGTVYPRLARMEADGLVTHTAAGARKVYEITGTGRAELASRAVELAELEREIQASVADLTSMANEIGPGVRSSVRDIKRELRQASRDARMTGARGGKQAGHPVGPPARPWAAAPPRPAAAPPRPAAELEERAVQLLTEVRRLTGTRHLDAQTARATLAVLDATLNQVRRLSR